MASVHDIASYILKKAGPMTAMKLQKLAYYSQAWGLVWDEKPLFKAKVEAWSNGPVVPALYAEHRGKFKVSSWPKGDASKVAGEDKKTVDAIIRFYGDQKAFWLSQLTHRERPWREARANLDPGERGNTVIEHAAMYEYYDGLSGEEG
jgi:uncharacterized phage-associated protein